MSDPIQLALDAAFTAGGVEITVTPKAGTGPVACRAIGRPIRDQVADLPALADLLGARSVGWSWMVPTVDYPVRFVAGDRLAWVDGDAVEHVYEVKLCKAHPIAPTWQLESFEVLEDETPVVGDGFMLPFYFAGTEAVGL